MALQITKSKVEGLMKKAEGLQNKVKNANKKAEEMIFQFLETGVTYGAAFGFGFLDGRYGGAEVAGMPGSLLAGLLLTGGAFLDLGGKNGAQMLRAAGNGAFAAHGVGLGSGVGRTMAIKAKELNPTSGLRKGQTGFVAPTDDQVKAIVGGVASGQRMLTDDEMKAFANTSQRSA